MYSRREWDDGSFDVVLLTNKIWILNYYTKNVYYFVWINVLLLYAWKWRNWVFNIFTNIWKNRNYTNVRKIFCWFNLSLILDEMLKINLFKIHGKLIFKFNKNINDIIFGEDTYKKILNANPKFHHVINKVRWLQILIAQRIDTLIYPFI